MLAAGAEARAVAVVDVALDAAALVPAADVAAPVAVAAGVMAPPAAVVTVGVARVAARRRGAVKVPPISSRTWSRSTAWPRS